WLSGWQSAAIIILLSGIIISVSLSGFKKAFLLATGIVLSFLLIKLDLTTEKIYWKPLNFITARDSPYSRIKLIKTDEQLSFYTNNVLAFNFPDLAAAEQAVHFAMLQKPEAKKVLLLGGGFNGSLEELLKYPEARVDYVELDPVLVNLAKNILKDKTSIFKTSRLSFITRDGRKFLQEQPPASYEVIISQLPEPVSLQLNRYYTVEFFSLVKSRLVEDGLFSFSVPASENYLSDERAEFLASLYFSLTQVFEEVCLLPGDSVFLLASSHALRDDFAYYQDQLRVLNLNTVYFRPEILAYRLTDLKKKYLEARIKEVRQAKLNYDQTPISYYFNIVLWSKQFKGWEKNLLVFMARHSRLYLFHLPLILIVSLLLYSLKTKSVSWPVGWPLFFLGFSTIMAEIGLLLSFQVHSGLVYGKISLLLSLFMLGLFLGSWQAKIYLPAGQLWPLVLCQAAMVIFLAVASLSYKIGSEYFYYGLF
ncbi:MAG: fused MFS/spermidine synthase, partial [Candidatus Aminicenantes bacterium]|nr:fused MFS/spermidine synthase [Candidatus Aminicenantes bacterium]